MKATLQFLEEKFVEFNNLCFEGKLPHVPLELSSARTFLGKLLYKKVLGPFGIGCGAGDFRIRISKSYDLPQNELEDVLIHEMIHYHIALNRLRDKSSHGPVFRKIMADINLEYGRHITVSHKSASGTDLHLRHSSKPVYVCISELRTGELGLTVCSSAMVRKIARNLKRYYPLSSSTWYFGYNEFLDRYPRSRTPKIYRLKREDLGPCILGLRLCQS